MRARWERPVLVITDRYPPDSHGGAEISLSLTVGALAEAGVPIVVAALSDTCRALLKTEHEGVPVYRVPFSPTWPPQLFWIANRYKRLPTEGLRTLARRMRAAAGYLKTQGSTPRLVRWKTLMAFKELVGKRRLGHLFPIIDRDALEMGPTVDWLSQLIATVRPSLVHADNYRSILYAARSCPKDTKLIGLVRDNRFFCSERNQSANIAGEVCSDCQFGCMSEVPSPYRDRLTHIMRDSLSIRHASLRRADKVIVTSSYLANQIGRYYPAANIAVVPNAADRPGYVEAAQANVTTAHPPEILCVGMVNRSKGQLLLAKNLECLRDELGDLRIVFAGRGELLREILQMAEERGMRDYVYAPGFMSRSELYRLYARATVVACPALWPEPFGRVPLEAGLSRKPVVAFAVGGLAENILHEETGLLVRPGDEGGFIRSLVRLVKNPEYAQRLGQNAYEHVSKNFTLESNARRLAEIWQETIG